MTTGAPFTEKRSQALRELGPSVPVVPGLASRLAAFLVDIFVISVACMFATGAIAWTAQFFRVATFAFGHRLVSFGSRAAVLGIIVGYLPLSWTFTGQSVGKALFGLRVVPARGDSTVSRLSLARSSLRFAGYWVSALPLGLGFWWAAFDVQHRALHDRLAGTRVVYDVAHRR